MPLARRTVVSRPSALAAAAIVAACAAQTAVADTNSTFADFNGDVSLNSAASFNLTGLGGTGPLVLDPNDPDILYAVNRAAPTTGGIYPFRLSTQSRITNSNGNIYIGSAAPMTWASTTTNDPYTAVVGNDGTLYVAMYTSAGLFKIQNPLSDAPTITRIMASYNNQPTGGTDDDIVNIERMPANFGLAGYSGNDLLVFDDGNNADGINTVAAVHADGSDGNTPTIVWQRATPAGGTMHGAVDHKSGYAYMFNTTPERATIDGTEYVTLQRLKGDGVLQTIGLKLPAGVTLATSDDPIAINPVDGSIWLADVNGVTPDGRTMLRVDTRYLTPTSDPNAFLANVTTQFSAVSFNMGVNGLTFSPDGKMLYAGTPTGTDKLWAFNVLPHLPGDPNGDGVINGDDFATIDRAVALSLTGFTNGDFNVDGAINQADYLIIDTAFGQQQGGTLSPDFLAARAGQFGDAYVSQLLAAVPEPASLAACALALPLFLRRRSR